MRCKTPLLVLVMLLVHDYTLCITTSTSLLSNITDLHSLLAFRNAIEVDPHNVFASNWTTNTNFCNWYGVSCSKRRQRVTHLVLKNLGLVGPISPHIGNLSFLSVLHLGSNNFHSQLTNELGRLSRLTFLVLERNNITGKIPTSLSLCRKLQVISLTENQITGPLFENITALPRLRYLNLGNNNLTGKIPVPLGNMSTLQLLDLDNNKFHGTVLNEVARLSRLTYLYSGRNYLTGTIPPSLFNISSLEILSLEQNSFSGDLPKDIGLQLPNLDKLSIGDNELTGSIPTHWYNISRLTHLSMEQNYFTGILPPALPTSLQILSLHTNNLQDEIPKDIGTLNNLTFLNLSLNRFNGTIPPTVIGMERIQELYIAFNKLEGTIPEEICYLRNLGVLVLDSNNFSGSIPHCIGGLSGMKILNLKSNRLSSMIPQSLWSIENLFALSLASNFLHGELGRDFTIVKSLSFLDLSWNQLSGNIHDFSKSSTSLEILDFSWNSFSGPIPESVGNLISLNLLNISNNNLSGHIPKSLEELKYLKYLELSNNTLSGEIPTGGPFVNFRSESFRANPELCGDLISKPCPCKGSRKSRKKLASLSYILPVIVVVLITGALLFVYSKRIRKNFLRNPENISQEQRMISYHELSIATNKFSEANVLGSGGFGNVYKGTLSNGEIVAVKLLNLTVDGAMKSFDAECKVLRTVRHRNLVKVISTCTNPELRALVLEYIPNGSLEKWLYSHNYYLSFFQRVSIMLDVAEAMDYLHNGQVEPVIHCDLKPSNVLLDEDMVAHVCDFGITKILAANKSETQTNTLGTFGYIAPEYGAEGRVSTKGDAYSYGIMLLETFTRKKPTEEMFSQDLSFMQWVSSSVSDGNADVIDENLRNEDTQGRSSNFSENIFLALLEIGLGCSRDSPEERFEIKDVVSKLNKIKLQILSSD